MTDYNGVKFYFQYANPVDTEEELSGQKRPRIRDGEPWESSPYFYWWLFLKKNEDYLATCAGHGEGPCRDLYLDFGDIRDVSFMDWWRARGRHLFCEPHGAEARAIDRWAPEFGDPDYRLVIEIERFGDLDRTIAEIRSIAREHLPANGPRRPLGDQGRASRTVSRALYQCFTNPNLNSLRQHYHAHELLKANPEISDDKLVKAANVSLTGRSVSAAAKAVRKQIKLLIHYAALGAFPITAEAQTQRVAGYLERRRAAALDRRREVAQGLHCEPFGPPFVEEQVPPKPDNLERWRDFISRTEAQYPR